MEKFNFTYSFDNLFQNLEKIISKKILENKKIILFGASVPSIKIKEFLKSKNYTVSFIIDNNKEKIGKLFYGTNVYSPEELFKISNNDIVILIASSHYKEMSQQLQKMGYIPKKHIFDVINFADLERRIKETIKRYDVLSLKEIQQEEFAILCYIKNICKKNDISYFLCAGTMLGAVRHKGFIPWDDDIDISVPYTDYFKLIELILQEKKYTIVNDENCDLFRWGYTKVCHKNILGQQIGFPIPSPIGLAIDIFPIYSLPDDEFEYKKTILENERLKGMLKDECIFHLETEQFYKLKKYLRDLWHTIGYKKTKKVMRTCVEVPGNAEEEFVSYEAYEKFIEMEFCEELFPVPIGYDEILKTLYGNYWELPPEEKRKSHHPFIYYRIN